MNKVLGLDIGGANVKFSDGVSRHGVIAFELWRKPENLTDLLRTIRTKFSATDRVAVTMTGELCDCYSSKQDGVSHIVNSVVESFSPAIIQFYRLDGEFVEADSAKTNWKSSAASNWRALASFVAASWPERSGFLVDIGSTTTDIVPISRGRVTARGTDDLSRLMSGELVYTGATRTPVCSCLQQVSLRGKIVPLAAEYFASMLDVYLVLGKIAGRPDCRETCDGRPATREFARRRLARMLCAEPQDFSPTELADIAEAARRNQIGFLLAAMSCVVAAHENSPPNFFISGSGEFLAEEFLAQIDGMRINERLSQVLSPEASAAAAAYAVACLASGNTFSQSASKIAAY